MTQFHETMSLVIRPYAPGDRSGVREICCETGDRGEPVDGLFEDRDVFADLVTRYYTDDEPQSTWIAEDGGRIVGYLTGCLDTGRYERVLLRRVIPRAFVKAVLRGGLFSRRTWRWARAGWHTQQTRWGQWQSSLASYPAHFHVNIRRGFRGQRLGERLVERFLDAVRAAGLPGVHVAVRADNAASCRFFERMGFLELERRRVWFPAAASYEPHETILYGTRV